jgi:polyhydroxyalkanoate synthase
MTPRLGPRPLALHLNIAMATWLNSPAALMLAKSGLLPWNESLAAEGQALAERLERANPEQLSLALGAETRRRFGQFMDGIAAYRAHPYRRELADPPVLWQEGAARLLDYGQNTEGVPVLFVPSLINRAYILDLSAQRSLMRWLAAQGFRPMLLDWGTPGGRERAFSLDDIVSEIAGGALDAAANTAGRPVVLVGYCMGGTLALPLALANPSRVSALVFLAAPWDFHAGGEDQHRLVRACEPMLRATVDHAGTLPTDVIQTLFTSLDPMLVIRKFTKFNALNPRSAAARDFVALEDWLNDGVPLAADVARTCLFDWYRDNLPGTGGWRIGGKVVSAQRLDIPLLNIVPAQDRIVPPASAHAISAVADQAEIWTPPLGHIGMIVSARARKILWQPLAAWLSRH